MTYVVAPFNWDGTDAGYTDRPSSEAAQALHSVRVFDKPASLRAAIQLWSRERETTSLDAKGS